jgi:hypothetical protein
MPVSRGWQLAARSDQLPANSEIRVRQTKSVKPGDKMLIPQIVKRSDKNFDPEWHQYGLSLAA